MRNLSHSVKANGYLSINATGTICRDSSSTIIINPSGGTVLYHYSVNGRASQSNRNFFFWAASFNMATDTSDKLQLTTAPLPIFTQPSIEGREMIRQRVVQ